MKKENRYNVVREYLKAAGQCPIAVLHSEPALRRTLKGLYDHDISMSVGELRGVLEYWADNKRARDRAEAGAVRPGTVGDWVSRVAVGDVSLAGAVMAHWARNCKRKLLGLAAEHDIMPILYGPQGAGKSQLVARLAAAMVPAWAVTGAKVSELADARAIAGIVDAHIVICDEMEGASNTDMDAIKSAITASTISYRPMGTNTRAQAVNCSVFIGTTNRDLTEILVDPTGMRRFYQVNTRDVIDWAFVNSFDFASWFAAIDPVGPSQLEGRMDELRAAQQRLVIDTVTDWLASGIDVVEYPAGYRAGDMHAAYSKYCTGIGLRRGILSPVRFAARLRQHGWTVKRSSVGNMWSPPETGICAPEASVTKAENVVREVPSVAKAVRSSTASTGWPGCGLD